jgi:CubicO group peptidase (beta-lactamase class C family)
MARWAVPGLAIGIFQDGETELGAYGVANIDTGIDVRPETLFQIGSISKIFTVTTAMTLVDEGKLDLDTPVVTYVPDVPLQDETARRSITLRHLYTHMSGFYGDRFDDQGRGDDAIAKAVAAFGDLPQQTPVGEIWTYCNAGFDLSSRAMELVTGQGFEAIVRERVFAPLGLDRATYFPDEALLTHVAAGHVSDEAGGANRVARPWPIPRRSNPAGGISANVGELLRFARMHMNDGELDGVRVLSPESARVMRTKQVNAEAFREWGVGWSRRVVDGQTLVEHNGATNGFTARLTTVPERGFAITILTNHAAGGAAHTAISKLALERLLGIRDEPAAVVPVAGDLLASRNGTYRQQLADMTLTARDGGYDVEIIHHNPFSGETSTGAPFRLMPVDGDGRVLIAQGGVSDGAYADFIFHADGSVRVLRMGGRLAFPG